MAKEVVHQLDIVQDSRPLLDSEIWLRNNLKKLSLALSSTLRTVARLRSRIGWLQEGDANTRLFHMHARHRKRKNFIAMLQSDERILTGHEEKAAEILEFYTNLIGTDDMRERTVDWMLWTCQVLIWRPWIILFWKRRSGTLSKASLLIRPLDQMALRVDSTKFVGQSSREI